MTTATKKQHDILLIEDNPLLLEAYKTALEEKEYVVQTTSNGSTSVELAKKIKPKVIILDLAIHGTQGLEVLEELKKQPETQAIFVIILTSSDNPKDKADAEALKVDGFYTKSDTSLESLITYVEAVVA